NHTTAPAAKGTPVPELTLKEIAASQPDPKVAKKSKAPVKRKASASAEEPSERDDDIEDTKNSDRENDLSEAAYYRYLKSILVKDEGVLSETPSVQSLRSGKRLGPPPPRSSNTSPSRLDCVGTSNAPHDHSYFDNHGGQGLTTCPIHTLMVKAVVLALKYEDLYEIILVYLRRDM
ncbi:hypothetical protein Tco_0125345, partial [Tanacetum coccineum]